MDNMAKILKSHNAKITKDDDIISSGCNCQRSRACPLNGNCKVSKVVYSAEVIVNDESPGSIYISVYLTL